MAAVALVPGCGSSGSRPVEEFPASSAAYQAGLLVGGAPVAVAFAPLTLLFAGLADGWGAVAVLAAPGLPTGVVTGVAVATPFFLVEALCLGAKRIGEAFQPSGSPSLPLAGAEPPAEVLPRAEPPAEALPREACARCRAAERCYCVWPVPEDAPRPDAEAPDGARPCAGCGEELRGAWASCPACGRRRP